VKRPRSDRPPLKAAPKRGPAPHGVCHLARGSCPACSALESENKGSSHATGLYGRRSVYRHCWQAIQRRSVTESWPRNPPLIQVDSLVQQRRTEHAAWAAHAEVAPASACSARSRTSQPSLTRLRQPDAAHDKANQRIEMRRFEWPPANEDRAPGVSNPCDSARRVQASLESHRSCAVASRGWRSAGVRRVSSLARSANRCRLITRANRKMA